MTETAPADQTSEQQPETTRQLVPRAQIVAGGPILALVPRNLSEAFRIAEAVHQSRLAPYGLSSPQAIMVAIMHGLEVGLPPMQALQSIAVINGKPSIYGDAGLALVEQSGLLDDFEERYIGNPFDDDFTATCRMSRKGRKSPVENSYSVLDAKTGNYWEGKHIPQDKRARSPWVTNPKRMLRWRARWFTMRDLFSDVLKGLAGAEEMMDVAPIEQQGEPQGSGFAERLDAANDAGAVAGDGFRPDSIAHELGGGVEQAEVQEETAEVDPEIERAGCQAAIDGEPRKAPTDLSPAAAMSWLKGYDTIEQR